MIAELSLEGPVKVVDSFMFSEPHERELLLLKLEMEDAVIDEWIVIEGAYTHQGEHKGHYIRAMLSDDSRFAKYRDKITILELNDNFSKSYLMPPLEYLRRYVKHRNPRLRSSLVALAEEAAFFAEKNQREAGIDYVLDHHEDHDFVILTDIDEMLDAIGRKRDVFLELLKPSEPAFKLRRKVFLYDYDNLCLRTRYCPVLSIKALRKLKAKNGPWAGYYVRAKLLWQGLNKLEVQEDLFYEFSYCFDKSSIMRKSRTYPHTGRGELEFERALLCNHVNRDVSLIDHAFLANRENWCEKIQVNEKNLPSTVVRNFERLRTNTVAVDYKDMRRKFYGPQFEAPQGDSGTR
jgi:hypothetical protein